MYTLTTKNIQAIETEMLRIIDKICRQEGITYYLGYGTALGAIRHQGPIPWDSDVDIEIPMDHYWRFRRAARSLIPDPFKAFFYDTEENYTPLIIRVGIKGYSHKVVHVDVFPIVGAPDSKSDRVRFVRLMNLLTKIHYCKEVTPDYARNRRKMAMIKALRVPLKWCRSERIEELFERLCHKHPVDQARYVFNPYGYVSKAVVPKDFYGDPVSVRYENHFFPVPRAYSDYLQHFYGDYMQLPPMEERNRGEGFTLDIPAEVHERVADIL